MLTKVSTAMTNGVLLLFVAFLALLSSSAGAISPHPLWRNSLAPAGVPASEVVVADGGRARCFILLPSKPSTQEAKAASDLAEWLGEITGAKIDVAREPSARDGRPFISVGRTQAAAKAGVANQAGRLDDEGYAVAARGGNLYLQGGRTRGPINAVYALLEEDLGCRWYSTDVSVMPHDPNLIIRAVDRTFTPRFEIRDPYYKDAFDGTWSLRNRTNSPNAPVPAEWGGHKHYAMFVHTFNALLPPDKYFAEHPDYFSENNGQRNPGQICFSNPEVVKIVAENVKKTLAASPQSQIISVSQNDSYPCCACSRCAAAAAEEGSLAGPLITFVNGVAEMVEKDYPDVRISTLAYLDTSQPPKTVRPRKNVAVQLCTDSHAWAEPFLKIVETGTFDKRLKAWAATGADLHIWDYTCNFSHYTGPMPNWQVVTDSIRYYADNGCKGVMLQGNYQSPGTSDGAMRCWVWAKQIWDPTRDDKSLMRDFVFGYYGTAAPAVWRYQELVLGLWEREHGGKLKSPPGGIRYPMTIFDSEFLRQAQRCFADAEKLAAGDQETLDRVAESKLQVLYARLSSAVATQKVGDKAAFANDLAEFEKTGRRMKVTNILEGPPDFDQFVEKARKLLAEAN